MKPLLLLSCLLIAGCNGPEYRQFQPNAFTAYGYVRNVWCDVRCNVIFEHDSGEVQTLTFHDQPPLWAGEHVQIIYHADGEDGTAIIDSTRRLP